MNATATEAGTAHHAVVSRAQWTEARRAGNRAARAVRTWPTTTTAPPPTWPRAMSRCPWSRATRCPRSSAFASGSVCYNFAIQAEAPGISAFYQDGSGQVFHTCSRHGRGVEVMMGAYALIDLVPRGRDEDGLERTMAWVRHHDRYETRPAAPACCGSRG